MSSRFVQLIDFDFLQQWDPDVQYENPLLILEDGYECLKNTYPMCVFNPHYEPHLPMLLFDDGLETVEYENFTDIKMKEDDLKDRRKTKPKIDRSSKAAVLERERKFVLDKTLQAEKGIQEIMQMEIEFDKVGFCL